MITWTIFLTDLVVRLLLAVRVVMRRQAVPVSLAWLVVILFVPLLGLPLYLLVGEVRLGGRRHRRHREVAVGLEESAAIFWRGGAQDWTSGVGPFAPIARLGAAAGDHPPLRGNRLKLLAGTDELLDALIADIDGAQKRCHLLFYIWMAHGAGERVAEAVIRASGRGVDCRVLVDAVGSKAFLKSGLPARLRGAGVRIEAALPVNPVRMLFARLDLRNHRKLAVIDGWIAYAGSHNITDASFGVDPIRGIGPWIDASIRIEGPGAQALEVVFLRDWQLDGEEEIANAREYLPDRPIPDDGSVVQVLPTGPGAGPGLMQQALLTTIYAAREELIITTPYFVPDEATRAALASAAMRGVRVTVVVPKRIDARLVALASRSHFADLLEAGVRVMEYRAGLLHAKTLTVDRDLGLIGSANMDMRSFWLNFEVSVIIYDGEVASHLRMLQVEYMGDSDEIDPDAWRRRPVWKRLAENAARLLGPLL